MMCQTFMSTYLTYVMNFVIISRRRNLASFWLESSIICSRTTYKKGKQITHTTVKYPVYFSAEFKGNVKCSVLENISELRRESIQIYLFFQCWTTFWQWPKWLMNTKHVLGGGEGVYKVAFKLSQCHSHLRLNAYENVLENSCWSNTYSLFDPDGTQRKWRTQLIIVLPLLCLVD